MKNSSAEIKIPLFSLYTYEENSWMGGGVLSIFSQLYWDYYYPKVCGSA